MGLYEDYWAPDRETRAAVEVSTENLEQFAAAASRCGVSLQEFVCAFNALKRSDLPLSTPTSPRPTGRRGIDLSGDVIRNND